jgi:hypothetical protein
MKIQTIGTIKAAKQIAGVVTKGNSKVHGSTFSVNPFECKVGSKLVTIKGSTCSKCYARKLGKVYPSALKSWDNNLSVFRTHAENDTLHLWIEGITKQILKLSANKTKAGLVGANYHRWFAAGDLDSLDMLRAIVEVAKQTPHISHWLPTREKGLISKFLATNLNGFPTNLVVRVSATMVDSKPMKGFINTSTVHKTQKPLGLPCPAYEQGGSCDTCTACWKQDIKNISYKQH